jgi:glutathione S-transferase
MNTRLEIYAKEEFMLKLYDYSPSQNGYKVRLLLNQLSLPYTHVEVDIFKGGCDIPEFLAINQNGRIPVLVTEGQDSIAESNAILFYLSEGTAFLSEDRLERAKILEWLFFEQYEHEPNVAVCRHWLMTGKASQNPEIYKQKLKAGYEAFEVMEKHLVSNDFFVSMRYTIADIALYAYTHVAEEGGFDMGKYTGIKNWISRIQSQKKYIPGEYKYY